MTIFSARYVETLEFQNWKINALLQTFSAHPVGKSLSKKVKMEESEEKYRMVHTIP